jgi:uncharacterized protein YndB with AHSA1/START domain
MTKSLETKTERISDRELVVTRRLRGPARLAFRAWTTPDLMMRWWTPASFGITFISCEIDARTGGGYRFTFGHPSFDQPMAFFGKYLEVIPDKRIVWTNAESGQGAISTLTFEEQDGQTLLVLHEIYPSKEALDAEIAQGSTAGWPEQLAQLDLMMSTDWAEHG